MEQTKKAIESAYAAQVGGLYKIFAQAILAADSDAKDIAEAEEKFAKGIAHANDVKSRALSLTG